MHIRRTLTLALVLWFGAGVLPLALAQEEKITEAEHAGAERAFGGIIFVWCPPGEFQMGSPKDEEGRGENELRGENEMQHPVELTKGFWLAKYECTQAQFEKLLSRNFSKNKASNDLPVENVSWEDSQKYCDLLREHLGPQPGWTVTLPTEAQWEYACRAGTKGPYAGELDDLAWHKENSGGKSHPVGGKKPNAWGLCDMHGNVWEWCRNWYEDKYEDDRKRDPHGPDLGSQRVLRGGSFNYAPSYCRSAFRDGVTPSGSHDSLGFRVALIPSE